MIPCFFETIKVLNGRFHNLSAHAERINKTMFHFFNTKLDIRLEEWLSPPPEQGLFRCRLTYAEKLDKVEFIPYTIKKINTLSIIQADLDYSFKSTNRVALQKLVEMNGTDEIIIIKDGFITDASIANLVFESDSGFFTPKSYLLPGTKRSLMLSTNQIAEKNIKATDLEQYKKVYLINAMIDLEDNVSLSTSLISQRK